MNKSWDFLILYTLSLKFDYNYGSAKHRKQIHNILMSNKKSPDGSPQLSPVVIKFSATAGVETVL